MHEKNQYMKDLKAGKVKNPDEWVEPNSMFRVGICLKNRAMRPVYFYTQSLHDAKFLLVQIKLYGNRYNSMALVSNIELAVLIDKVTKFQRIMSMICFAHEKRFVTMNRFQELAADMVEVAEQAHEYRRHLANKWFSSLVNDDEAPVLKSAFRSI